MTSAPTVELFAIGTELILGLIQDTNSYWLAQQIAQLGGQLRRVTMLRDDRAEMLRVLNDAVERGTDVIITTGGLGPTPDDMTVEVVAELIGAKTIIHEPTIAFYMQRRNLKSREEVTPNLVKMATIPEGAEVFFNPVGWAPCIKVRKNQSVIFILPGPPREMEALFTRYVAEFISANYQIKTAKQRVLVHMFESEAAPLMQKVMQRFPGIYLKGYVALRASADHALPIDLFARGSDAADAQDVLAAALDYFAELVREKGKQVELYEGELETQG
ncbi:MAG: competence/damage-inducible protein A [Abditibacteriales bacterium]|nr:competence/damage-inducible protein A [Abditibacteriales bacterium]MDW8365351.1 competence/damage-inducible protein A [Abditibacteriales bacterium]